MITERNPEHIQEKGVLTVIWGPMFSGKTEELIERKRRASYADKKTAVIKPASDDRYDKNKVVTHYGDGLDAHNVDPEKPENILEVIKKLEEEGEPIDIVAIDEGQFFAPKQPDRLVKVVEKVLATGKDVIVAGLAVDANDEPFGAMPTLVVKADVPTFQTAICTYQRDGEKRCGSTATKTERLFDSDVQVVIGGANMYAASCRTHHGHHPRLLVNNE